MRDSRPEGFFTRPAITRGACHRSGHAPRRGGDRGPGSAVPQQARSPATPVVWEVGAPTHSGPSRQVWGGPGRRGARPVRSPRRGPLGAALPALGAGTWAAPEHRDHKPGHGWVGLDPAHKTVGATERSETVRAAWHALTRHLPPERLSVRDACGRHHALTPRSARGLGSVPLARCGAPGAQTGP